MQNRSENFKNLLLNSEHHLIKCKTFSEFEKNYIDKNYDNFLIELKYKLISNTNIIPKTINEDFTLFEITKTLLETEGLIERFKYKEFIQGLNNDYEIITDFNYVLKFNSEKNKFELNNKYHPYFGIKNVTKGSMFLKGTSGHSKMVESFGSVSSKSESQEIINQFTKHKEVLTQLKKKIKTDLKELFGIILNKKIKKYNELLNIPELNLNRNIDNKILSFEEKQNLCKPLIESWLDKNVLGSIGHTRKYFYPNFIISLYDSNWILYDFDSDEYFAE